MLLTGKTLIVTGGATGIGRAIVLAAVTEGANVVIDHLADHGEAADLIIAARGHAGTVLGVEADVSRVSELRRLVSEAVRAYGRIDVMVNNAGVENRDPLLDTSEEAFDRIIAVNLKSAFFGTQLAAQQFITQQTPGLVLTISSVHENWPMPGNIAYCVSKGGARMLTRTAGVELGPHGIRVINIAPGAVATPINAATEDDPAQLRKLQDAIPLGRVADASDIADVVVFLASGKAAYMTATTVVVDGGIMQGSIGL